MWKLLVSLFSFFWWYLSFTGSVEALRLKTNWGDRVNLSEKIVRGQVISIRSYWNPEKTLIYTEVKVRVNEYLKGDGPKEIMLNIPGGTVYNKTQWVSDAPQFNVGDDDVIFLESSGQITGGPDGVYRLKGQDGDGFLLWLRAFLSGDPKISREGPSFTPRLQPK
jgi:hypothetical protein